VICVPFAAHDRRQNHRFAELLLLPLNFVGLWEGWRGAVGEILRTFAIIVGHTNILKVRLLRGPLQRLVSKLSFAVSRSLASRRLGAATEPEEGTQDPSEHNPISR
jgi:hypothetical protein